ncbi:hypothetical protein BP5796_01817 [Coleophoma crateriformis]|uniref:Heterokaryon incompatibility domain-containing protein n=1 Tax=Coleophoma crateriformis TaxID=565419 RepID=A0A3D8T1H8_9HELO|nr:hypothetical protein BP5796_01817 [Coleophoma crateriformis]
MERNQQVRQMARIYSQATRVLVWLGLADQDSEIAISFLERYERSSAQGGKNRNLSGDRRSWAALSKLCSRSYWERVWIVQEVGLAEKLTIFCGQDKLPWFYLARICQTLHRIEGRQLTQSQQFVKESLPARLNQQRGARKHGTGTTLWSLLKDCEGSRCQDPHDIIYGFLGLADDYSPDSFAIDYGKSLESLYSDVVHFQYKSIAECQRASPTISTSLILQFSEFLQDMLIGKLCHYNGEIRKMITDFSSTLRVPNVVGVGVTELMSITATSTDRISQLGPGMSASDEELQAWEPKTANWKPNRKYSEVALAEKILKTNHKVGRFISNLEIDLSELDFNLVYPVQSLSSYATITAEPAQLHEDCLGLKHERISCKSSKFFVSEKGFLGLAPAGSSAGDMICTFERSSLAVVVEKIDQKYVLVGRAIISALDSSTTSSTCPEQDNLLSFPAEGSVDLHLDLSTLQDLTRYSRLSFLRKDSYFIID